jgi:4-hydroxythreonine-4-phosphate dehydrogenase
MRQPQKPLLGITMGDPGGIGPEICAKALLEDDVYRVCRPLIIGDAGIMTDAVRFSGLTLRVNPIDQPPSGHYRHGTIDLIDLANLPLDRLKHKRVDAQQGKASFEYITRAIEMALADQIDGTVTGPINKAAINAGGFHYAGHTEIYAALTHSKDYAMMLAEDDFRVVHVSTHVSLREACERVQRDRVLRVIQLTHDALLRLGIESPRIGVAGLNPHCGEGGMFGTEDETEIAPAVKAAHDEGIHVEGPIPADTVFSKMRGGMYEAVVVMYHDQGHIPTKLIGFQYDDKTRTWGSMAGVNVTLGLPIVRTSVDHGTAFGKAGEGRANPESMVQAIRLAARLSQHPAAGKGDKT